MEEDEEAVPEVNSLRFVVPIKLPSLANLRLHWRSISKLKKWQKLATAACMHNLRLPPLPVVVTIVRFGPIKLDDDNLAVSAKYVRDEIARAYGVDDGDARYVWKYGQCRGKVCKVLVNINSV